MPQQQSGSSSQRDEHLTPDPTPTPGGGAAAAQANTADLDSLLDEIDSVLESNAEEFVKGFVQKGGQ